MVHVGRSTSSRSSAEDVHEFVHFAVPVDGVQLNRWKKRYGAKGLAILLAFDPDPDGEGEVLLAPAPSAFSFGNDPLLIRVNCAGLMELTRNHVGRSGAANLFVRFVVLGWSGGWN